MRLDWKFWVSLAIAIAGLILAALTMIPKPSIALEAPLDPRNVLTTRFVISNDGVLSLKKVKINLVKLNVSSANDTASSRNLGRGYIPPAEQLEPGDKETVPFYDFIDVQLPIVSADIALVADFKPIFAFFPTRRKAFRFKTTQQADGTLRLEAQPPGDVLEIYDDILKKVAEYTKGVD